jgi:hypothetical protein
MAQCSRYLSAASISPGESPQAGQFTPSPEKRHRDTLGTAHAGRLLRSTRRWETATCNPCKRRLGAQAPHRGRWLAIPQFATHKLYVSWAVFGFAFTLRRLDRPFAWQGIRQTAGIKVNLLQSHDLQFWKAAMRANANHPRSVSRERGHGATTWRTEQWAPFCNKDMRANFPFGELFPAGSNIFDRVPGGRRTGAGCFFGDQHSRN